MLDEQKAGADSPGALVGIAAIGVGIGVELATHADIGWGLVTTGSCLVAIGGVIWGKFMRQG